VEIRFERPGFAQSWSGVIEGVKPAMGFINVMRSDFHLHLKAGAVADWQRTETGGKVELTALDAEGNAIGLSVVGPAQAFLPRPAEAALA
jgi:putative heme degradation protein